MKINPDLTPKSLRRKLARVFDLAGPKILAIEKSWNPAHGTRVFTVQGKYTSRGWTEWTQGFQFGSALLQYEATGETRFLELGRGRTVKHMATHVSHVGVHDHGFNNISTYGNLWRLMREGKAAFNQTEKDFYELALKVSGAIQAARWTSLPDGLGYIYSFNGPHSLFVDTVRSLRVLAVAHQLGHVLMGERDRKISLLQRLIQHGATTARFNIWHGTHRDAYDVRGRTAHESIFNLNDGSYRCPSSQQGYSPFSTWTRGLAWAILGFAEQLEFLQSLAPSEFSSPNRRGRRQEALIDSTLPADILPRTKQQTLELFLRAAEATADFYLHNSCEDGILVWDTGAPNLHRLGDYRARNADPFNAWEPVDSSASAIAAQGLLRLGHYLRKSGRKADGVRYVQAGLTIAARVMEEPYLSTSASHQGLLLHSVYHRPNGWDYIAKGQRVPNGESSMWGDYHLMELALLLWRESQGEGYLTFFEANRTT
jgi:hypothetical protein